MLTAPAAQPTPVTSIAVPGVSFPVAKLAAHAKYISAAGSSLLFSRWQRHFPKEQWDSGSACAAMAEFSMAYDQLHARSGPTSTGGASTGAGGQVNRLTPFRGRSMHATPE